MREPQPHFTNALRGGRWIADADAGAVAVFGDVGFLEDDGEVGDAGLVFGEVVGLDIVADWVRMGFAAVEKILFEGLGADDVFDGLWWR